MRELGHFICIIVAGSYYTESEVQICWIDWCVPDGTTASGSSNICRTRLFLFFISWEAVRVATDNEHGQAAMLQFMMCNLTGCLQILTPCRCLMLLLLSYMRFLTRCSLSSLST